MAAAAGEIGERRLLLLMMMIGGARMRLGIAGALPVNEAAACDNMRAACWSVRVGAKQKR